MNFGYYIGNKKGQEPGANIAINIFKKTHSTLYNKVKSKSNRTREDELLTLNRILTNYFFPVAQNGENLTNSFISDIIVQYNEVFNEKISTNNTITQSEKYNKDAASVTSQVIKTDRGNTRRQIAAFEKDLGIVFQEYNDINKQLSGKKNLTESAIKLKDDMRNLIMNASPLIRLYYRAKAANNFSSTQQLLTKRTKELEEDKIDYQKALQDFSDLVLLLNNACAPVTAKASGDLFEFALSFISTQEQIAAGNLVFETQEAMLKYVKEQISGGQSRGKSDNGPLTIATYFDETSFKIGGDKNSKTTKKGKNGLVQSMNFTVSGVTFTYQNNLNDLLSEPNKMGKMDILMNIPQTTNNFRVSAKNWSSDYANESLGGTNIMAALYRNIDTSGIEIMPYALQHPGGYPLTSAVLIWAHRIVAESMYCDVVMGLSQKQNYADTLVILDRKNKKVDTIDIPRELLKVMNGDSNSRIYLKEASIGDPFGIGLPLQGPVREMRKLIFDNTRIGEHQRSYRFVGLVYNYLHGLKLTVGLKN